MVNLKVWRRVVRMVVLRVDLMEIVMVVKMAAMMAEKMEILLVDDWAAR